MRKPSRDVLDFYIYDCGYDEALMLFGITDKQAENILYNKPTSRKRIEYKEPVEKIEEVLDEEKLIIIWNVIAKYYKLLRRAYVRYNNLKVLNANSETFEDMFHNALVNMVKDLSKFKYINDEKTIGYIKTRCYFEKLTDDHKVRKLKKLRTYKNDLIENNLIEEEVE